MAQSNSKVNKWHVYCFEGYLVDVVYKNSVGSLAIVGSVVVRDYYVIPTNTNLRSCH